MTKWVCYECGGTNVWELSWVRANRISWMLMWDDDVHAYTDTFPASNTKCMDCGKLVELKEEQYDV